MATFDALLRRNHRERSLRKDLALALPRTALGATMLYHGADKLRRPRETAEGFEAMGIRPGGFWSRATGLAEAGAGLLALAGVLTRPAALAVLATQGAAVAKVHARNGFAAARGGYEHNLSLLAIAAALLLAGPGRFSSHRALEHAVDRRSRRVGPMRHLGRFPLLRRFARVGLAWKLASRLVHLAG
jgi:putative oxidoreductase